MKLSPLKSFLFWLGSCALFAAVGFGTIFMVVDHVTNVKGMILMPIMMGPMFGSAYWGMIVIPSTIRANIGWLRFRPIMWVMGVAALLEALIFSGGVHPISFADYPVLFISAFIVAGGWGIGYLRNERAVFMEQQERTKFLASLS
jgi:hypothetical protein